MNPADMSNEQLAWELEKPCGGRENGIEFDLLQEAARRLRASVSKDLYDAAWTECLVSRSSSVRFPGMAAVEAAHDAARKEAGL